MMPDNWRLTVDRSRCVGSTICVSTAPGEFALESDGQSRAERAVLPADERVMRAAELCPLEAISVEVDATGERLFPVDD
ncbi:ferredoxin [Streptomyces sp. NPDC006923]|uniref:ferredoxin n=1 Tax=Streptomyces sp. NPDC006923 TaxID=3155355 RepID=UPI0033EECA0F